METWFTIPMTTTQSTEARKAALDILTAEAEIAFIQRTDSPAKHLVWEAKVALVDQFAAAGR